MIAQQSPRGVLDDVVEVFGLHNVDDPASSREFKNDV